jgi:hypothetical protein
LERIYSQVRLWFALPDYIPTLFEKETKKAGLVALPLPTLEDKRLRIS